MNKDSYFILDRINKTKNGIKYSIVSFFSHREFVKDYKGNNSPSSYSVVYDPEGNVVFQTDVTYSSNLSSEIAKFYVSKGAVSPTDINDIEQKFIKQLEEAIVSSKKMSNKLSDMMSSLSK